MPVAAARRRSARATTSTQFAANGLAYDGIGALAFITSDPLAIRGVDPPRINPANPNFGLAFQGPTVGYGDLELDRTGAFALVGKRPRRSDVAHSINNFLFRVARPASVADPERRAVWTPAEELLGSPIDPYSQVIYFSSFSPTARLIARSRSATPKAMSRCSSVCRRTTGCLAPGARAPARSTFDEEFEERPSWIATHRETAACSRSTVDASLVRRDRSVR